MSADNTTAYKRHVRGRRLQLVPRCSDCRGCVESLDQLDLSLVRFRQPRCKECFIRAKLDAKVPKPEPKRKRLVLVPLTVHRECVACGKDHPLDDYVTKTGKDAPTCSTCRIAWAKSQRASTIRSG